MQYFYGNLYYIFYQHMINKSTIIYLLWLILKNSLWNLYLALSQGIYVYEWYHSGHLFTL
jgi:hypothetical protein